MRSSIYVYVLLALSSSLTLAAPLSAPERRIEIPPPDLPPPDLPPPVIPGKCTEGTLRPVVGQAGHPSFPLPPDLDSPVAMPTPIIDCADQGGSPQADVLGRFFKGINADEDLDYRRANVNKDYRRADVNKDYRRTNKDYRRTNKDYRRADVNKDYRRVNKDYRRLYVDALRDLLQGAGELS